MASNKKTFNTIDFDCSLSRDSLDYLKINKQPFIENILTQETFFSFPALEKITENLQHQAQFSDLLLIIEGPYGSGKTSLFRNLIHHEIENTKSLPILAEATDTLVQIQQKISEHLQDLGDANHLDDNLKSLQSFSQTPLIIIDDSHVLSDTTLQELIRYKNQLSSEHEINLKLILFANEGLSSTLQKVTALDSNQMYVQRMPTYTNKLTAELIFHKLKNAGYNSDKLLSESEFQLIDKKSDHTPLNIMYIASDIIEKDIAKILNPPKPLWIKALIGTAFLIIASIAASFYFGVLDTNKFLSNTVQEPDPATTINETALTPENNNAGFEQAPEKITTVDTITPNINPAEILKTEAPVTLDEINKSDTPLTDSSDTSVPVSIPNITNELSKESEISEPLTESTPPTNPTEKEETPKNSFTTQQDTIQKQEISAKETSTNAIKKETIKPIHPALEQLNAMGLHDTNWLLKQKNTEWTLQLLGAREPETLLSFSRQHALTDNAAWYKTWLKGKPYYVLVYGNYPDRDQARDAIATLPENLQSIKPWAKSIKSVQQTIK